MSCSIYSSSCRENIWRTVRTSTPSLPIGEMVEMFYREMVWLTRTHFSHQAKANGTLTNQVWIWLRDINIWLHSETENNPKLRMKSKTQSYRLGDYRLVVWELNLGKPYRPNPLLGRLARFFFLYINGTAPTMARLCCARHLSPGMWLEGGRSRLTSHALSPNAVWTST